MDQLEAENIALKERLKEAADLLLEIRRWRQNEGSMHTWIYLQRDITMLLHKLGHPKAEEHLRAEFSRDARPPRRFLPKEE